MSEATNESVNEINNRLKSSRCSMISTQNWRKQESIRRKGSRLIAEVNSSGVTGRNSLPRSGQFFSD